MNSKILIVDDSEETFLALTGHLAQIGFQNFLHAESGQEAFDVLTDLKQKDAPIELVFLNWNIRKLNGFEFIKLCRRSSQFKLLPIVLLVGQTDQHNLARGMKMGASDHLMKPISRMALEQKIKALLVPEKLFSRHG